MKTGYTYCSRLTLRCTLFCILVLAACKSEPTGPETDCALHDLYVLDHHFLKASNVFDIRTDPPTEIRNDTIEYELSYQALWHIDDDGAPYPYSEYFIDSIAFVDATTAVVKFFEYDDSRTYTYTRTDCRIELFSTSGDLHLELTLGGDEISEKRYAIFDHSKKNYYHDSVHYILDTFSFIEFRLAPFSSYEEIIKQFAADHPGEYDTVAIELVENKTRE